MDTYTMAFASLSAGLVRLPIILVQIVGLVFALVYWRRHPKVSLLVVFALAISFCNTLSSLTATWLPITLVDQGWNYAQIGPLMTTMGLIASLVAAISLGLLLFAVFGWRQTSPPDDDAQE